MESASELWKKVFTKNHLRELFENKIRTKTSIGLDWITLDKFSEQLDAEIDIVLRKCNQGTYHFTRYREFLISKGPEKAPRCISIPTIRDKLVLSALNEVLTGVYGKSVVAPMPQVVIAEIRDAIDKGVFDTYIKIDIKTFYASINHKILLQTLKKRIRKKQIVSLIKSAITTASIAPNGPGNKVTRDEGLPEGLSISNTLANLYLRSLDAKYMKGGEEYKYWRYVDDILILTTSKNCESIRDAIFKDIDALSLKTGDGKTNNGEIDKGFDYLGYFISKSNISVRRSSVIKLERSLESVFRSYKSSKGKNLEYLRWRVNLKITGFIFDRSKRGWVFFYSQIDDYRCLFHLDWFVSKLAARYGAHGTEFKKFIRTYKEIENALHSTKYIPNLDTMSIDEKREIVRDIYGQNIEGKDDSFVERRFRRIMQRELRDIQKDVQAFS